MTPPRTPSRTALRDRLRLSAVLLAALLVLAACGSQLDPDSVARTSAGSVGGVAVGGEVPGSGAPGAEGGAGATGATDPGSAAGAGGASGDPGGAAAPGTSGAEGAPGGGSGGAAEAADGGRKAADCARLANQTGITADTITIANVSDISGPVPGIFESAQEATRAYVAYFNSTSHICGRKLKVQALDSRADAGADQQAYTKACDSAFAAVGSMSAFDSGGAGAAAGCGLPDLRSTTVSPQRRDCRTCFAAQAVSPNLVPSSMPRYLAKQHPSAVRKAAVLYINASAAPVNAESFKAAWSKDGWSVVHFQGIDVAEFNYSPYVQQMKEKGVELVVYVGPYQNTVKLQQAMQQQSFEPEVFLQDATIQDERYVEEAGGLGDGTYVYSTTALFDDLSIPEMELYRAWLDQVKPGASPNYYGLYAWSATRLFVEQAVELGGRLDRPALVGALSKVQGWTGNGVHAPQQVGAKTTTGCVSVIRLSGSTWKQVSPGKYMCAPLTNSGVGG